MTYQLQSTTITFEAAIRDLSNRDLKVRTRAAHALGDVTDPDQRKLAAEKLIEALSDDHGQVRSEAALALGDLQLEIAVERLAARLGDGIALVRQSAAIALGRLGFSSGFAPLLEALKEGSPDIRFQAATSLVEIDAERAYEPLLAQLSDEDGEVLGASALGLGSIGRSEAAPRIKPLLRHDRLQTRLDAAYALAQLGSDAGVTVLAEAARDKNLGWDAIEALELAGTSRAADALDGLMATPKLPRQFPLRAAAALLAIAPSHPGAESARRVLLGGLRTWRADLRGLTVEFLGTVGGDWAVAPLTALQQRRQGRKLASEIAASLEAIQTRAGASS